MKTIEQTKQEIEKHNRQFYSFWNKIKKFFSSNSTIYFPKFLAKNNWKGIPKQNLTWKEVSKKTFHFIIPMTLNVIPFQCPHCKTQLKEYKSDKQKIENTYQYMVVGKYCPKGCYTYLECC
jgi:hypothetical protein